MSKPLTHTNHERILGLRVQGTDSCGARRKTGQFCSCVIFEVAPHSSVSSKLVWKCCGCHARRGKLTDERVEALDSLFDRHGDPQSPLQWCEDFGGYFVRGWDD